MPVDIGPRIGIDGEKEFRNELNNISQQVRTLGSEMKAVTSAFDANDQSQEKLTQQSQVLTKQIEAQEHKLELLQKGLDASAQKYGESDTKTMKWAQAVNNATADLNKMRQELDRTESEMDGFGDSISKLSAATVAIGNLAASAIQSAVSAVGDLIGAFINLDESTEEYRRAQGRLMTAFEAAGYEADTAQQAFDGFYRVLGDTDTAAEASQLLAKLAQNAEDVGEWTRIAAGVSGTFGDSLPIEGLIEASNETAKVGEVTGVLADALNWAGISEDKFNEKLAACGSESERNQLIMDTLSGTYDEAADAFYKNNEALIQARDNQNLLSNSLSGLGEAIGNIKNKLMADMLPTIFRLSEALSGLLNGDMSLGDFAGQVAGVAGELVGGLVSGIQGALPRIQEAALAMIGYLSETLADNLPALIENGLETVSAFAASLRENAGLVVDGAIELAKSLAQGLADSIPTIIENVPEIVSSIANTINDNAPKIFQAAVEIIGTLVKGLIDSIPTIIANLPKIISAIVDTIMAFNWLNLGGNIIRGIGNGIKSLAGFLKQITQETFSGALQLIKGLPSQALQWGKDLITNFVKGITGSIGKVVNAVKNVAATVADFIGFSEPEKGPLSDFHTYAPDMMKLYSQGIKDNLWRMTDAMDHVATQMQRAIPVPQISAPVPAVVGGGSGSGILAGTYVLEVPLYINGKELYRATIGDLVTALNNNARAAGR